MNLRSARKIFARSPATYRPMVRWIWGDHPNPARLVDQLDHLLDMGFGGALIQPGAALPAGVYLGEAWFEAVSAVAKRARKGRASLWIAEDLEAPATRSVARGIVEEYSQLAARILVMADIPAGFPTTSAVSGDDLVAAFEVTRESVDGHMPQLLRSLVGMNPSEGAHGRRIAFHISRLEDRLNPFDAEATQQLLSRTHQLYHTQARKYFGNTIGLCLMLGAGATHISRSVPWDADIPALFQETHGYALLPNLPALFFDLPGCEAVRVDFWSLLDEMFSEGFTRPFARWCRERDMPHACALPHAGDLSRAVPSGGHAMARFVDHPFAALVLDDSADGDTRAIARREAASIKRQLLHREGVAEIFTSTRGNARNVWSVSVERLLSGTNFCAERCALDSLRGDRKHAVPCAVVTAETEDGHARAVLDVEARLAWMLGQGQATAGTLLLHPYTSLQATYSAGPAGTRSAVHASVIRHFTEISRALAEAHIEFDYADEAVLARHGHANQRELQVGSASYRVVVLPPLINIRSATLGLLHDFATGGGRILAVGSLPEYVDGRRSEQMLTFFEEYGERIVQGADFGRYHALVELLIRAKSEIPLKEFDGGQRAEHVVAHRRRWDEIEMLALLNAGDRSAQLLLDPSSGVRGAAELWDPLTGRIETLGAATAGEAVGHTVALAPGESSLIVYFPEKPDGRTGTDKWVEESRAIPPWTARRTSPNAAALGECQIADRVASADRTTAGEVRRWLGERIADARGPVPLRTEWRFRVAAGAPAIMDCFAVVELSEGASVRLDGTELVLSGEEWVLDPSMRQISLPPLTAGEHSLEIWRLYAAAGDFQAPWLRGPFADVTLKDECTRIAPARESIQIGRLDSQGMRGYFGGIVYAARADGVAPGEDRRVELRIRGLTEVAEVRVDGSRAGVVLPPRTSCDLTEWWRSGTRSIEVVLRVPPDGLLAQLNDGSVSAVTPHGLPAPPELVVLSRR